MVAEFFDKAEENLQSAKTLLDNSFYNASANRAYYSAFQIAVATLAQYGFKSDKNEHRWVQSTFSNELIRKRKIFPGRIRSYLMEMQRNRNTADYTSVKISKKIAKRQFSKAKEFLEVIKSGFDR